MERSIAITEKQAGTLTRSPQPSPSLTKEIMKLLTKFAERRQAQVTTATLLTFAEDLSKYPLGDIEAGLLSISSRRRADGETAFPEIATVVDEVLSAGRNRRIAEERERRMADEATERRRRETHPEEFEPIGPADLEKMAAKLGDKFNFDKPKPKAQPVIDPMDCPHCGKSLPISSGVRRMTSQELRDLADVIEQIENQSAANRDANKIHAQKCIAEQLANLPATPVPAISEEVA